MARHPPREGERCATDCQFNLLQEGYACGIRMTLEYDIDSDGSPQCIRIGVEQFSTFNETQVGV